jgi:hypothetical protein
MKSQAPLLRPRVALLIGAALTATPALAQDAPAPQQAAPPAAASAPEVRMEMAPAAPVVQTVPSVEQQMAGSPNQGASASDAAAAARPVREARNAAPVRQTAAAPVRRPVSATAVSARIEATAPAAPTASSPAAPAAAAPQPAAAPAQDTATTTAPATTTEQTQSQPSRGPAWPWILGGLIVLGALAALLLGRRRRDAVETIEEDRFVETPHLYETPVHADQAESVATPVAEPVFVPAAETRPAPQFAVSEPLPDLTPVEADADAHVEAEIAEPEGEDLARVTDAPAPVANRPWLEFGLRPVRAGTSEEEALVDVELTVGNAGDSPARDVRISTFMLADAEGTEMEQLLTEHRSDAAVPPVSIAPGDGTRVDAHLAVPKGELGRTFNPVVVAEARYTLPDGREGLTSAAFRIGRSAPGTEGVGPIGATRPHMVEDVEAELLGAPEHA